MTTERKLISINTANLLLCVFIAALAFLMQRSQQQLNRASENRYLSKQLANELRFSSDELTRLARTYAVTADPRYEAEYWNILAVRNGQKPRPDGRTVALRGLMQEAGFTQAEFAKLKEAEDNSNGLVTTETIAMNAVKGLYDDGTGKYTKHAAPDLELARRIMHDEKYHQNKAAIMAPIDAFEKMLDERTQAQVQVCQRQRDLLFWLTMSAVPLLLVLAAISFGVIRLQVVRPLNRLMVRLQGGSDQIHSAAKQVASSSQSLASGASEQAASLEETSASLEEMASMTKQNADNAQRASELARQTRGAADTGASDMQAMSASMESIKQASDEIAKIIKTIDEIAFQTNILALNAAVEAARAGEAGMGFAVVADEVRNLAQRCAQAARETAGKIEGAITKTTQGVQISAKVAQSLQEIVDKVHQVDELVAEVAAASKQQNQGIEQVNVAVAQMDEVTQSTAASAEESASAAQELNAQAEELKAAMRDLIQLVGDAQAAPTAAVAAVGPKLSPAAPRVNKPKAKGSAAPWKKQRAFPMPEPEPAQRPEAAIARPNGSESAKVDVA